MPVKAIGARAILDFPDEISFGTCPVKVKVVLVYNFRQYRVRLGKSYFPFTSKEELSVRTDD